MKHLFSILFIFQSAALLANESKPAVSKLYAAEYIYGDTLTAKKPAADTTDKFSYAEMYFSIIPGNDKVIMWVAGDDVDEKLKKLVSQSKYRTWGLTHMGDAGWELVSTIFHRNPVTIEYEFYFYFKKRRK